MYTYNKNLFFPTRMMVILVIALSAVGSLRAQSHGNHVMVGIGGSYPRGLDATITYEHETEYHSAWEYFMAGYLKYETDPQAGHITNKSFWQSYNTWTVGAAYKPCVARGRNHHGNVRIGVSCGSDLHKVIGAGHVGYEHTFNLYDGWSVFFQVKEDVVIRGKDTFRTGVSVGVKIPL